MTEEQVKTESPYIVFFDGVCHICNSSVDLLLKLDKKGIISYAPLQGKLAEQKLGKQEGDPDSMVFLKNGKVYEGFDAVIQIGGVLYPFLRPLIFLFMIPPMNLAGRAVYRLIAKHRYSWFGRYETCKLANNAYADRFYD